jgi:long-chain acyl-CoA synthetase
VVNPINVMLTPEEVAFVLNDCGSAAIFTTADKAEVMGSLTRAVPTLRRVISFDRAGGDAVGFGDLLSSPAAGPEIPRPAPTDLSTIGYTSGTTGHPKGAMQSHRAVFLSSAAPFAVQTRTDRDVMLNALPLPHVYGNIVMNGTFMAGATLVLMERFDAAAALAEIQRHHATVFDGADHVGDDARRPLLSRRRPVLAADLRSGRPDNAGREDGRMGGPVPGTPAGAVGDDRTGRRRHQ